MRLAVREDPRAALGLMQDVLRAGGALAPDYPLVFNEGGPGRAVVIEEAGRVISTCAILERELRVGDRGLRVGLIGSVATAAECRGRGLASAVLARAEAELRAGGCLLSLLWADTPAYYVGRGYREVGAERDILLPPELVPQLPAPRGVREARAEDHAAMHALYRRHEQRVERSERESHELFQTPGMDVLVLEGAQGAEAYACCGRGEDLAGVIHEWAGAAKEVLACVSAHVARAGPDRQLVLMSPHAPNPVAEQLLALGCPSAVGVLGMGKLLDPEAAAGLLAEACGAPQVYEAGAAGGCRLVLGESSVELTAAGLLDCLLPARAERAALESLGRRLGVPLEGLPLDAFVWGLDSI